MHPPSSSSSSAAAVAAGACLPRPSWRGGVLLIYLAVASALTTALLLHLPAPLAAATTSTATPITTSVPCASASQEASIQRYGVPAATAAATAAAAATTAASAATAAAAAGAAQWVCAVSSAFQRHPVVYSIGSNAEFSFERDISLLLHTSPLTFDPFVPPDFAEHLNQTLDFLTFFSTGLSSQATLAQTRAQHPEQEFLTLAALMARHGHAYVDVLKLDCEGCEEDVLLDLATTTATRQLPRVEWQREEEEDVGVERRGGTKGLAAVGFVRGGGEGMVRDGEIDKVPPVGQILVEMHRVHNASATLPVVRQLESVGYRLFHSESNPYDPKTCMELAFIHRRLVLPPGR
ncbi:hypothetical protein CLOM_g9787 [Closterium sp. NIES-68]|nr:hypothetical protein CLOM_g9787 [Closterium sp. NIES-68]